MAKKHNPGGLVYSTNPDFRPISEDSEAPQETLSKEKQKLKVRLDSKQRAGKLVTLVEGFIGSDADLQSLGKELKTKCGAGGSVKEGIILIQGDYKEKIIGWLKSWGYGKVI